MNYQRPPRWRPRSLRNTTDVWGIRAGVVAAFDEEGVVVSSAWSNQVLLEKAEVSVLGALSGIEPAPSLVSTADASRAMASLHARGLVEWYETEVPECSTTYASGNAAAVVSRSRTAIDVIDCVVQVSCVSGAYVVTQVREAASDAVIPQPGFVGEIVAAMNRTAMRETHVCCPTEQVQILFLTGAAAPAKAQAVDDARIVPVSLRDTWATMPDWRRENESTCPYCLLSLEEMNRPVQRWIESVRPTRRTIAQATIESLAAQLVLRICGSITPSLLITYNRDIETLELVTERAEGVVVCGGDWHSQEKDATLRERASKNGLRAKPIGVSNRFGVVHDVRVVGELNGEHSRIVLSAASHDFGVRVTSAGASTGLLRKNVIGVSSGAGATERSSIRSAIREAWERASGVYRASIPELPRRAVTQRRVISGGEFREHASWLPDLDSFDRYVLATAPVSGEIYYVPAALCYFDHPEYGDGARVGLDSTGCAAGSDLRTATRRAVLELIERDVAARWWRGGSEPPPRVPLRAVVSKVAIAALDILAGVNRDAFLLMLGKRFGCTVLAAVTYDRDTGRNVTIGLGSGAQHQAIRHALREALAQCLDFATDGTAHLPAERRQWYQSSVGEMTDLWSEADSNHTFVPTTRSPSLSSIVHQMDSQSVRCVVVDQSMIGGPLRVVRALSPDLERIGLQSRQPSGNGLQPSTLRWPF